MISGGQVRAARALLGLSAAELAEQAGVGWATVQRIESSDASGRIGTLEKIREALEAHGITFIGDPLTSPGVQLVKPRGPDE